MCDDEGHESRHAFRSNYPAAVLKRRRKVHRHSTAMPLFSLPKLKNALHMNKTPPQTAKSLLKKTENTLPFRSEPAASRNENRGKKRNKSRISRQNSKPAGKVNNTGAIFVLPSQSSVVAEVSIWWTEDSEGDRVWQRGIQARQEQDWCKKLMIDWCNAQSSRKINLTSCAKMKLN